MPVTVLVNENTTVSNIGKGTGSFGTYSLDQHYPTEISDNKDVVM